MCSLLLGILPKPGHKCEAQSQSFVPVSEDDTDDASIRHLDSSFVISPQSSSKKVLLLKTLVNCLHELGGFYHMGVSKLKVFKLNFSVHNYAGEARRT